MAEKVDMSLDDIIAMTRKRRGGGSSGSGSGGRNTNRGGRRRNRGRGGNGGGLRGLRGRDVGNSSGSGRRNTNRGGRGRNRGRGGSGDIGGGLRGLRGRGGVQKRRPGSFGRTRNLADDTVWVHDLYDGGRGKPQINRYQQNKEARLMVSNLNFAVNDSDIYELFASCGPVKRGTINYDRSGRSMGNAEVVFEIRPDAEKAMKQYNNVPLDGIPMEIEFMDGADEQNGSQRVFNNKRTAKRQFNSGHDSSPQRGSGRHQSRGSGQQQSRDSGQQQSRDSGRQQSRGGGGRGRGRGRGRGGRSERKVPTAEELDSQLDAYITAMDTD